ncbi:MAG: SDR family oxidoreductase [Rhizobiales bacterium]|nr:SDR family oxidoreductase [Hyphomicrobiales bacterium]
MNQSTRPVALVTGASSGIGAACALQLAQAGYNVAINFASNKEGAAGTAAACEAEGTEALVLQGDVSDDAACRATIDQTITKWGRLDVLVNNAGTTKFVAANDLDGLTVEDFERICAVNVAGAFAMTRAARPHLEASPIASVVNVSSQSGISGIGSSIAYSASKGALNTLTLSLARTLAPHIRVNAVCPGFVDTGWHAKSPKRKKTSDVGKFQERIVAATALKRMTTADDVADAVCWFATGAKAVTGTLLYIDGGTHLTVGSPL